MSDIILCDYCGTSLHDPESDVFREDTQGQKCVPMLADRIRELEAERDAAVMAEREACHRAAVLTGESMAGGTRQETVDAICDAIRSRPSDALAARDARDKRVRDEALREAAENLKAHAPHLVDGPEHDVGFHYGYHIAVDRILNLIEGDQTDE